MHGDSMSSTPVPGAAPNVVNGAAGVAGLNRAWLRTLPIQSALKLRWRETSESML